MNEQARRPRDLRDGRDNREWHIGVAVDNLEARSQRIGHKLAVLMHGGGSDG
eukprot:SAG31_NODE_29142_length_400_cov_0.714286_1_plen_52_part_00